MTTGPGIQPQTTPLESNRHGGPSVRPDKPNNLSDARKGAQAAILRLWPLEVRYQDYVDEGIDENVVHALFSGLGLDTKSARANQNENRSLQSPETHTSHSDAPPPAKIPQIPSSTVTAEASRPAAAGTAEERKDRIARRLMAAKAAKQASPGDNTQTPSAATGTKTSAASQLSGPNSTSQASATVGSKASTEASQKKAEKERLLQEKLAKLQESRALRAQKASEKASSTRLRGAEPEAVPPPPATQEQGFGEGAEPSAQPVPPIPGLFLSPSGSPLTTSRKRPVASDLNENSTAPSYKRTFNQHYIEKPLIIDVSDGSDDEDIEMELSSPVDDPAIEYPAAKALLPKASSFRDHPPLTNKRTRHRVASPASHSSNGAAAKDPDTAKLGHLTQNISQLKEKIAELERQKGAKAGSKDSPGQSSHGTPAAESQHPTVPDMAPTRSPSAGLSLVPQGSPTPVEPDVQRTLPKAPRPGSDRGFARREQIRVFSDKLPGLDASIATVIAKQRVLESQLNRARKEAEELRSQRDRAHQELERLHAESTSPEPEQAQGPNGQQQLGEYTSPPSGERGSVVDKHEPVAISAAFGPTHPERSGTRGRSEIPLANANSESPGPTQSPQLQRDPLQPMQAVETEEPFEPTEDTAMDESRSADGSQELSDDSNQGQMNDAMHIDTDIHGDEAYNPPESSTEHKTEARELQAQILSPALADDTTPPILANTDSQEFRSESAALPDHISQGVTEAAGDDLDLPPHVYDGQPAEAGTNLISHGQPQKGSETPPKTAFVPYESVLRGFLSYRFHPNFYKDVAGGLRSPTYSNKINPQVPFCLDFLLGSCTRGASCKYQHIDAVGISGKCFRLFNSV